MASSSILQTLVIVRISLPQLAWIPVTIVFSLDPSVSLVTTGLRSSCSHVGTQPVLISSFAHSSSASVIFPFTQIVTAAAVTALALLPTV